MRTFQDALPRAAVVRAAPFGVVPRAHARVDGGEPILLQVQHVEVLEVRADVRGRAGESVVVQPDALQLAACGQRRDGAGELVLLEVDRLEIRLLFAGKEGSESREPSQPQELSGLGTKTQSGQDTYVPTCQP